jgi:hypothetical protein
MYLCTIVHDQDDPVAVYLAGRENVKSRRSRRADTIATGLHAIPGEPCATRTR